MCINPMLGINLIGKASNLSGAVTIEHDSYEVMIFGVDEKKRSRMTLRVDYRGETKGVSGDGKTVVPTSLVSSATKGQADQSQ